MAKIGYARVSSKEQHLDRQLAALKDVDKLFTDKLSGANTNIQRAIYFHWENNRYVITQGFTKKTQKTPKREIKKGLRRRDIYERRHHHE